MNYTAPQRRLLSESDFERRKKERELRASGYDRTPELERLQQRGESNAFLHLSVANALSKNTMPSRISERAYKGLMSIGDPTFAELFYIPKENLLKNRIIGVVTIRELEHKIRGYVDSLKKTNPREVNLAERWVNSIWQDSYGQRLRPYGGVWIPKIKETDINRIVNARRSGRIESFLEQSVLETLSDPLVGPGLSKRAQNSLRYLGNPSFRELFSIRKDKLLKERNTGIRTVKEIQDRIIKYIDTLDRVNPEELDLAVEWVRSQWVGSSFWASEYLGPGWVPKLRRLGIIK